MKNQFKISIIVVLLLVVVIVGAVAVPTYFQSGSPASSPAATNSPSPTITYMPSPTQTVTNSPTPESPLTASPSPTTTTASPATSPTSTAITSTPTPTLTNTPSPTITNSPSPSTSPEPTTRVITDMGGYNVTVPVTINRIVVTCQGGVTQEIAALGGADKIVGQPSMAQFPTLLKLYPAFNNVTDSGSFANINVETILALEPDVVIASKSSSQTELYQKLVTAGIPVVGVNTGAADINTILTEFRMMGQLLNNSTQADKMINFWNTQLEVVADHLQSVPSENRTTVFYVRGGSITRTDTSWGQAFISTAGGINVAAVQAPSSEVNLEQLLEWNPDMIIICKTGSATSISFVTNSSQLQNLDAIKNNQVYMCPVGTFWWERPSPEAVLGITWLAHTMYPDQFADVDIYSIAKTFYQEFFNYNLSSSEFATMLSLTS